MYSHCLWVLKYMFEFQSRARKTQFLLQGGGSAENGYLKIDDDNNPLYHKDYVSIQSNMLTLLNNLAPLKFLGSENLNGFIKRYVIEQVTFLYLSMGGIIFHLKRESPLLVASNPLIEITAKRLKVVLKETSNILEWRNQLSIAIF